MSETNAISRPTPSFLPSTALLEMTYRCNNACLFCPCPWEAEDGKFEMKYELGVDEWKSCIAMLIHKGVASLAFTGGEPLLKPHVVDLIEFAARQPAEHVATRGGVLKSWHAPPDLYLLSNGKFLSEDILRVCRRHRVHLCVNLPGLTTYQDHTRREGPDDVLYWMERAHALGIATSVLITVTKLNLFELYETIAAALLAGTDTILLNRFQPCGRGLTYTDQLSLSAEEIVQMLDTAENVLGKANRYGSVGAEIPKCLVDPTRYKHLHVGTRCSAAIDLFVVGPSGYIRVCRYSPVRLNHFTEIDGLLKNEYWMRFVRKDYLPAECRGCVQGGDCDGGCREAAHIVGGEIEALDPATPLNQSPK